MTDPRDSRPALGASVKTPPVDDARLTRSLAGIEAALVTRQRLRTRFRIAAPAGVLALAALVLVFVIRAKKPLEVEAQRAPVDSLVLPEGSRVAPSRGARFALDSATRERVAISLDAGDLELNVSHVDGRTFTVAAGGHEVTVVGTHFRVWLTDSDRHVHVSVERGRVRVSGPGVDHSLGAGESWSAPATSGSPLASASAPASAPSPTNSTHRDDDVDPSPEPSRSASTSASAADFQSPAEAARTLFARGLDARRDGRDRDAARAFDRVRKDYRNDPRAGLAAYELGRIRLDALHDPAGAVDAFTDAIGLSPAGPFREDAEARRVDALDALGDRARCLEARKAYLTRYPAGIHAHRVTQRCADR